MGAAGCGLTFLDKEQMSNLLEREGGGPEFDRKPEIKSRTELKRRLEYVGFSQTEHKIYLSRQYNIEVYRVDGTFEKEFKVGGGCTKYPISLVTGVLDDRIVLYGDTNGGVYRLDPTSGRCRGLVGRRGRILIKFEGNEAGDLGAMVFQDRSAAVVGIDENITARSFIFLPSNKIVVATFRPGVRDQLLTAGEDGRVVSWQVGRRALLRVYRPSGAAIGFAAYTEDGARIVAVDDGGKVYVWDADSGALLQQHEVTWPNKGPGEIPLLRGDGK